MILSEITLKVLPLQTDTKTIIVSGLALEHSLGIMGSAIASSNDPSGVVFYPGNLRNNFVDYLNKKGIGASVHFDPPLHKQKIYSKYIR